MEDQLPTENVLAGTTLNERLYMAGLLADFDEALANGEKQRIRAILAKVHLTPAQIEDVMIRLFA